MVVIALLNCISLNMSRMRVSLTIFLLILLMVNLSECQRIRRQRPHILRQLFRAQRQFLHNFFGYAQNIHFKYYDKNSTVDYMSPINNVNDFNLAKCDPRGKFAIIVHGFRESCDEPWVQQLVEKLNIYRGGCIICMDYGRYTKTENYVRLVRQFEPIVEVLTAYLYELGLVGFAMDRGYMFGFSYGGQLICEAGRRIGKQTFGEIDTCDMAGLGFDFRCPPNQRLAAQNVQCIHTSRDKGTRHYNCHQNWRLGNCGYSQNAASDPPLGSHGLCPYMYIAAFENNFLAVEKPTECESKTYAREWPDQFKMGYMENRKSEVRGELFAYTGSNYPYNNLTSTKIDVSFIAEYDYLDSEFWQNETTMDVEKLVS